MIKNTVYIGKDNVLVWELVKDGSTITEDSITDAVLWVPTKLTTERGPICVGLSSSGGENYYEGLKLIDNKTKIEANFADLPLKENTDTAHLTIYDNNHPNGIAWEEILLNVVNWNSDCDS